MTVVFGLLGALSFGIGSIVTKDIVDAVDPRRIIGPLYAMNAVVLAPGLLFEDWVWSWTVAALHVASVAVMGGTALAVFALFAHGSASAVTTAQALSPLPAAVATAMVLPGAVDLVDMVLVLLLVVGLVTLTAGAFPELRRTQALVAVAVAAAGGGLLTVISRLLYDEGVGVSGTYVVRTAAAAVVFIALVPPGHVPRQIQRALPVRAVFITGGFALSILAVQRGSPHLVQSMIATVPLFVMSVEFLARRRIPDRRTWASAVAVVSAVTLLAIW